MSGPGQDPRLRTLCGLMADSTDRERTDLGLASADQRLLTVLAAARYLGVTEWAVRRWISQRRVPFVKLGRCTRLDRHDLDRLIERSKVPPGKHRLETLEEIE